MVALRVSWTDWLESSNRGAGSVRPPDPRTARFSRAWSASFPFTSSGTP